MEDKIFYILIAIAAWSIPWKGFALWKSARRGDSTWFIALLLINTVGILEIAYLFLFSNTRKVIMDQSERGIQN
ncbi:MAG: DUF5652 family protein [Candidatus Moranbacteria bacterium]|nr:DUF5652 family protein [Candidatus Moranbacteria bacterium]